MLEILESHAGVIPHNKAVVAHANKLFYISSSNLVVCGGSSESKIHHFDNILNCVAVDSSTVALGDINGTAIIMNMQGMVVHRENVGTKILDCCFISSLLVAFSTFDSISIFNLQTNEKFSVKTEFMIDSIASSENMLLVGSNIGALHLYSVCDGSLSHLAQADAHLDCIRKINVCGSLIITCSQDSNAKIWCLDGTTIQLVQALNGHSDWINGACLYDQRIYTVSADKTVRIWEKSGNNFYVCSGIIGVITEILSVGFISDRLFIHMKSGGIDQISDFTQECEYFLSGHLGEVTDLDWNRNLLVTCSLDRTTRLFYAGVECGRAQMHGFPMATVKFLPGQKLRLISAGNETILRVYEATKTFFNNCKEIKESVPPNDLFHNEKDFSDVYKKQDEYIESAFLSELNLTNEVSHELIQRAHSEDALCSSVFKECQKIYGHYFEIKNIAVGRDLILSCNRSAVKRFAGLFVWDLLGNKLQYIEEHNLDIQRICISPDQSYAVTVGRDHLVCLYAISDHTLSVIEEFRKHTRAVWDCGFSCDSKYFATCSRDGKILFYDTDKRECVREATFGTEITAIDFSPVQDSLIAGTGTGRLLRLDYDLNILEDIQVVGKRVNIAKFNRDGSRIAVGGSDWLVRVLKVD